MVGLRSAVRAAGTLRRGGETIPGTFEYFGLEGNFTPNLGGVAQLVRAAES